MASFCSESTLAFTSLLVLHFLVFLPPTTHSQTSPISADPTVTDCTPRLLPLAPCAPFVQGMTHTPVHSCCDNLNQLYLQDPGCICLLLTNTNLSPFPINRTLALDLPALCNVQIDISSCSGTAQVPSSTPPTSQVSLGKHSNSSVEDHTNSSVAASPVIQVTPRSSIIGFGRAQNTGVDLKAGSPLVLLVTLAAISLLKAFHWV